MNIRLGLAVCLSLCLMASGGCVERILTVQSVPSGALVTLNDEEWSRTPAQHDFVWYGTYDMALRKEGYKTLKVAQPVIAPWYEWVPFDLVAEILPIPFKDHHTFTYKLEPLPEISGPELMRRAEQMKGELQSPIYRKPATHPAKSRKSGTRPSQAASATRPAP